MHSKANVLFSVRKQTRIALILNETMFFPLASQLFLPAFRRRSETQDSLTHSPHHTSAIRQNLRVPAFRWLCVQLFAFTNFSVEKSLCVVCHKSFASLVSSVETPCQEHTDALYCCCSCKATFIAVRFFTTSRSVPGSPHCRSFHHVNPAARHDVIQQATRPRTPLRRLTRSPGNRVVSDELAPWTSLSCPCELGKNPPSSSQGRDSFHELVEELKL